MVIPSQDNPHCHKCGADDSIVRSSASVKEFECGTTWAACIGGWKPHRQSLQCRVNELEAAAALNAAERRDAERKLLEDMAEWIRDESGYIESRSAKSDADKLLAEYAALQTEKNDGLEC